VVAAAADDLVVELPTDLGELRSVLDAFGHQRVDLFELRNELFAAVGTPRRQRRAHGLEFL
jgi:hypothetical protein